MKKATASNTDNLYKFDIWQKLKTRETGKKAKVTHRRKQTKKKAAIFMNNFILFLYPLRSS